MVSRTVRATLVIAATALLPLAAQAQPPFGGGGGQPPFGGGRGGGGGFGFGAPRDVTLASVPLEALVSGLALTDEQKKQIGAIQQDLNDKAQEERRAAFQGGGGGFDPQAMREMMQEMQDKQKKADIAASKEIEALLTDDQKKALPEKIADWKMFQQVGLPIDIGEALKLSPEQKKILAEAAKRRPQGGQGRQGGRGQGGGQGGGRRQGQNGPPPSP
jgi:predicted outer membrane protein